MIKNNLKWCKKQSISLLHPQICQFWGGGLSHRITIFNYCKLDLIKWQKELTIFTNFFLSKIMRWAVSHLIGLWILCLVGGGGPHLAVLVGYSWVWAKKSLLNRLGDHMRCWKRSNSGLSCVGPMQAPDLPVDSWLDVQSEEEIFQVFSACSSNYMVIYIESPLIWEGSAAF